MINLKRFCLLLVLVFLVSSALYSDDLDPREMTDQEILTELIQLNEMKANQLAMRESALNERENTLDEREQRMIELGNFSQNLREEVRKENNAEFWRGFGIGFGTGFGIGAGTGVYVGVKIPN